MVLDEVEDAAEALVIFRVAFRRAAGVYHLRGAGFVLFGDDGDVADAFVGFALDVATSPRFA